MLEILPRDCNLKPIFTQKWVSVDMNWRGGGSTPKPPTIPTLELPKQRLTEETQNPIGACGGIYYTLHEGNIVSRCAH